MEIASDRLDRLQRHAPGSPQNKPLDCCNQAITRFDFVEERYGDFSPVESSELTSDFISECGDPSRKALDRGVLRRHPGCHTSEVSHLRQKHSDKGRGPRFRSPCSHQSRRNLRPPEHPWFQQRTNTPARYAAQDKCLSLVRSESNRWVFCRI
jgi:hypothetical protein